MSIRPIEVVLDARLAARGLGIGRFVGNLMTGFREGSFQPDLFGVQDRRSESSKELLQSFGVRSAAFSVSPRLCGFGDATVVHYASNSASLSTPKRSVVTVYDLFQREAASFVGKVQWQLLRQGLAESRILAPISAISSSALTDYGIHPKRIRLITPGMRSPEERGHERVGLLAFGGMSERKRPELLVSVIESLASSGWDEPVTVVARAGLSDAHRSRLLKVGVDIRSDCTDVELTELYFRSSVLLVTSSHEGFGLPLVEAAEHQLPTVLGADASVAPEAIGPHCTKPASNDPRDWVAAIRQAASVQQPLTGAYLPSWKEVADAYAEIYRELG